MDGPQTLLPHDRARSSRPTRRSGSRSSSRGSTRTGRSWRPTRELLREGMARGPHRPADRRRADRRAARAHPRRARRGVPARAAMAQVAARGGPGARPRRRPRRRPPRRRRLPRRAPRRRTCRRRREDPGLWSAPDGDALLPDADPRLDDARPRPEELHRIGLDELESIEAERAGHRPRRRASATTRSRYRAVARRGPGQHPADAGRAGRPRHRRHRAGDGGAPARLRPPAARRLRRPAGRGVQGAGRAVRLLLPADRRRLAARDLLRRTRYDLPSRHVHQARVHDLPRGRPGPPLPDRPRDGEPGAAGRSGASARACVGGAYVEGWGLYSGAARRRAGPLPGRGRALRHARRAGLAGRAARRGHRHPRPALAARALDRLSSRPGSPTTDAIIETDRYICWPGQALTYKLGQREIERLRRELAARDGAAFDLRALPRRASSATARCRSRRSPPSCRAGSSTAELTGCAGDRGGTGRRGHRPRVAAQRPAATSAMRPAPAIGTSCRPTGRRGRATRPGRRRTRRPSRPGRRGRSATTIAATNATSPATGWMTRPAPAAVPTPRRRGGPARAGGRRRSPPPSAPKTAPQYPATAQPTRPGTIARRGPGGARRSRAPGPASCQTFAAARVALAVAQDVDPDAAPDDTAPGSPARPSRGARSATARRRRGRWASRSGSGGTRPRPSADRPARRRASDEAAFRHRGTTARHGRRAPSPSRSIWRRISRYMTPRRGSTDARAAGAGCRPIPASYARPRARSVARMPAGRRSRGSRGRATPARGERLVGEVDAAAARSSSTSRRMFVRCIAIPSARAAGPASWPVRPEDGRHEPPHGPGDAVAVRSSSASVPIRGPARSWRIPAMKSATASRGSAG